MFKNNEISTQNKILTMALMIFIGVYFVVEHLRPEQTPASKAEPVYADTIIPRGHVLVPIEIANIQTVAGLIDQVGVIDLYAGSNNQQNSFQIATRIKVLRAPLNPNQYAVLVTEAMSKEIMKYKGPFWAVVQNRQAAPMPPALTKTPAPPPTSAAREKSKPARIEIEYYKGG